MAKRKVYLSAGILFFSIIACNMPSNPVFTETVSPSVSITNIFFTQIPATETADIISTDIPVPTSSQPNPPVDTTPPSVQPPIAGEHRVQSGETLSCIGRGYGVLPNAIAEANGIGLTSVLTVGQILNIPFVQWTSIPAGPICPPQFSSPYPGMVATNAPLNKPNTPTNTELPFAVTFTLPPAATRTPTSFIPNTPSPTCVPGPTAVPGGC